MVGNEFETVDFRNRIYKWIYSELHDSWNYEALQRAFHKHDSKFDGTLSILEMRNALKEVLTTVDETSIEKFIKFLEKDKRGRINYSEFINKMNDVSNWNHNPFQQLARWLAYFIKQNGISIENLLKKMSISE